MAKPKAPALLSPAAGLAVNTRTPKLEWNRVDFGTVYQIQISKTSTFQTKVKDFTGTELNYISDTNLADGLYYWRVRAFNLNIAPSPWSTVRSFKVDTIPPSTPRLNTPANGKFTPDTTPTFSTYAAAGAKYYRFQVSESSDFTTPLIDQTKTGYTFTVPAGQALAYQEGYYWRAKAIDAAANESGWSAPRNFNVTFQKTPNYSAFTTDTTPIFTWAAVAGVTGYELAIEHDDHSPAYQKPLGFGQPAILFPHSPHCLMVNTCGKCGPIQLLAGWKPPGAR